MADVTYVDQLADDLRTLRPDLLRAAEDELQGLRTRIATVVRFLHNPAIALDIRQHLAADLQLPAPEK